MGCEREGESGVGERVWWERESVGHERVGCVRGKERVELRREEKWE